MTDKDAARPVLDLTPAMAAATDLAAGVFDLADVEAYLAAGDITRARTVARSLTDQADIAALIDIASHLEAVPARAFISDLSTRRANLANEQAIVEHRHATAAVTNRVRAARIKRLAKTSFLAEANPEWEHLAASCSGPGTDPAHVAAVAAFAFGDRPDPAWKLANAAAVRRLLARALSVEWHHFGAPQVAVQHRLAAMGGDAIRALAGAPSLDPDVVAAIAGRPTDQATTSAMLAHYSAEQLAAVPARPAAGISGRALARYYGERFGADTSRWQLALALMGTFEGTAAVLADTVDTLTRT